MKAKKAKKTVGHGFRPPLEAGWITYAQAAAALACSKPFVSYLVRQARIRPCYRFKGSLRSCGVNQEDVSRLAGEFSKVICKTMDNQGE